MQAVKDSNSKEEAHRQGLWAKLLLRVSAIGAFLALIVGLGNNASLIIEFLGNVLSKTDKFVFRGRIRAFFFTQPVWLLVKLVVMTSVVMALIAVLWQPSRKMAGEVCRNRVIRLSLKLLASFSLSLLLSILAIGLASDSFRWPGSPDPTEGVSVVCPQCAQLGTCAIQTYANNGKAHYSIDAKGEPGGPRGHAKITLQAYRPDEEHNAGWVVFLPRGSDLGSFSQLRFWIRGEKGGEQIGVKIKDAQGVELPVVLKSQYILGGAGITAKWSEASLPLQDFPLVKFDLIDNFSFYVNGKLAGTEPQTIYVGGFEWR